MQRPTVRGKFFFEQGRKRWIRGVTYGPFRPRPDGNHLPSPEQITLDAAAMKAAELNLVRLYYPPPLSFLDQMAEWDLQVLVTIPDYKRNLFLDDAATLREIRQNVETVARRYAGHPGIFGYFIDNEMPPDLVRWYGPARLERFCNTVIGWIKAIDPTALVSYANYPPTEYLQPSDVDFLAFNLFLHQRHELRSYLARLQNLAGDKPLILSECGMDTLRHSGEEQADFFRQTLEEAALAGLAGALMFAWTDEWFTRNVEVDDWAFGLVTRDRTPKPAYYVVQQTCALADRPMMERYPQSVTPFVSVVVCAYNAADTLEDCLQALRQVRYPNFEIIVVDDGSTDATAGIAARFPEVRLIRQSNGGLSAARNVGIRVAQGDVVAFTDADCMPDEDWLYFLVHRLQEGSFELVGGPNLAPPARNLIQAAVAAAPGAPCHVLLDDVTAEHVPGCNLAGWKTAFSRIGGFDEDYRQAGDDVDLCWRILSGNGRIGFTAAAVVWHYRRRTILAYFKQQAGYGAAEARLCYKHRQHFGENGAALWRGGLYGAAREHPWIFRPVIYHGKFGAGWFQSIYSGPSHSFLGLAGSLEWTVLTGLTVILAGLWNLSWLVPGIMAGLTLLASAFYVGKVEVESTYRSGITWLGLFFLSLLQPWVRGWARYFADLQSPASPAVKLTVAIPTGRLLELWSEAGRERLELLEKLEERLSAQGWHFTPDSGWMTWDLHLFASRWWHVQVRTMSEAYPQGRTLTRVELKALPTNRLRLCLMVAGLALLAAIRFHHLAWILPGAVLVGMGGLGIWTAVKFWRQAVAVEVMAAARLLGMWRIGPDGPIVEKVDNAPAS